MTLEIRQPKNRAERRIAAREKKTILRRLLQIELNFYKYLFTEEYDYNYLYKSFLDIYVYYSQSMNKYEQFDFFKADEHYFKNLLKPNV